LSGTPNLPANDSALFSFRFCTVHRKDVRDCQLRQFFEVPNRLFRISHAMSSAGQALHQSHPCIITQRNRASTIVIGDSGGYQIATNQLRISGNADRMRILRWLEKHTDLAMTLDVPTGPVRKPGYAFKTSSACLNATLVHLDFFQKHRVPGKIRLLNVHPRQQHGRERYLV
jgi:hypothetical protein